MMGYDLVGLVDVVGPGVCDVVGVRLVVILIWPWPGELGGHVAVRGVQDRPERVLAQRVIGLAAGGHLISRQPPAPDQPVTDLRLWHR